MSIRCYGNVFTELLPSNVRIQTCRLIVGIDCPRSDELRSRNIRARLNKAIVGIQGQADRKGMACARFRSIWQGRNCYTAPTLNVNMKQWD
jgi:hypothetical protein